MYSASQLLHGSEEALREAVIAEELDTNGPWSATLTAISHHSAQRYVDVAHRLLTEQQEFHP